MSKPLLEAVTGAIGDLLNEAGGQRVTRLAATLSRGSPVAFVESTFGWPDAGTFVIGGVVYEYEAKDVAASALLGITHREGSLVVIGAKKDHPILASVVDYSLTYSALDRTKADWFVDTAEGDALSTLARNIGVRRAPSLDDDALFRKVIKATAYARKGTMLAIEQALTAFFGAGNFEIWENFPTHRNTVFIRVTGGLFLAAGSQGKAFLPSRAVTVLDAGMLTFSIPETAQRVYSVRFAPEESTEDFTEEKPSVAQVTRYEGDAGFPIWEFLGGGASTEANSVTVLPDDEGVTEIVDLVGADGNTAQYFHTARILPESDADFEVYFRPHTILGTKAAFTLRMVDGAKDLKVGVVRNDDDTSDVGFVDGSDDFIDGSAVTVPNDGYIAVAVRKRGTDPVELRVSGALVQALAYESFPNGAANKLQFGCQSTHASTPGSKVWVKSASFGVTTPNDLWNLSDVIGETVNNEEFKTNSGAVLPGDAGKSFRTFDAATPRNNGEWVIQTVVDADNVILTGRPRQLALVESAHPDRVRVAHDTRAFKYPDDVGKLIDLSGAQSAPNPGVYVIDSVLDPVTGDPITGDDVEYSDRVSVLLSPGFVTETEIPWRLHPDFAVESPISYEMVDTGTPASGNDFTLRAMPAGWSGAGEQVDYEIIVDVMYSVVRSAHLTAGVEILNDPPGLYYPVYLPTNPLGPLVDYLDDLTKAGVIPEVTF